MRRATVIDRGSDGTLVITDRGEAEAVVAIDRVGCEEGDNVLAVGGNVRTRLFPTVTDVDWVVVAVERSQAE